MAKLLNIERIPVRITPGTPSGTLPQEVLATPGSASQETLSSHHSSDLADIPALYGNERFD